MKKTYISLTLYILFFFVFNNIALSWDNTVTHKDLSEYAAEISVLSKDKGDYLKNLGFYEGLKTEFKWQAKQTVPKWLREGANLEDQSGVLGTGYLNGKARSYNHFHNPLKQWDLAGLDDWITKPPYHVTGKSSLLWAQDGDYQKNFYEGDWSWKKVREHYYTALTGRDFSGSGVASTKEKRDEYFAMTFRGLGHQMHLIQDASQPDHVRNDAHPEDSIQKINLYGSYYFEEWAKVRLPNLSFLKYFAPNPISPMVSFDLSSSGLPPIYAGLVPITQLIDTYKYNGANPSTSREIGMAEYTNANFFSDDTIFAAERYSPGHRHYFPYPKRSSTDLQKYIDGSKTPETVTSRDGITDTSIWISKERDGEIVNHFVRPSYLTPLVYKLFGEGNLYYETFYLDNIAHSEYAYLLLQRAVGYSAGLLNYFFRGEMDMIPDDMKGSGYVIVNNTDEDMGGQFELWYDRKTDDTRVKVDGATWTFNISKKSSGNNKSTNITFTPPDNAKEHGKYMLVFSGRLGNEEGAVVGKEISLIPPLVFLIYQDAQNNPVYAVWSIEDDGKKLVSYDFDISKYATYFNIYNYRSPSTVKSDDTYQNHIYTIENFRADGYFPNMQYGKVELSSGLSPEKYILGGVRNCWLGKTFDYSLSYTGYGSNYLCSGRHSTFRNSDGTQIRNLDLWKINSTSGQIRYTDEDGNIKNGAIVPFLNQVYDIYAVLSPDKFVGLSDVIDENWPWPGPNCSRKVDVPPNGMWIKNSRNFYFGSYIIDKSCSCYYDVDWVQHPNGWLWLGHTVFKEGPKVRILDYDNLNIDENFILFYKIDTGKFEVVAAEDAVWGTDWIYEEGDREYKLAYKVKEKDLVTISICRTGHFVGGWHGPSVTGGQRLSGISAQATNKYLIYTYTLWTYSGPILEDYFNALNTYWEFNKRVLGIIDTKTGVRTEYEVNNELLGQYKNTFDKTPSSAIGFHNGSGK